MVSCTGSACWNGEDTIGAENDCIPIMKGDTQFDFRYCKELLRYKMEALGIPSAQNNQAQIMHVNIVYSKVLVLDYSMLIA